ncbi:MULTISPECIES: tetratricopeptide repeat protein [Pseudomonas]|jgi:hypothetical protein|uniref:Lipoprotein n=1 Tax=Pseudomonas weihenstephanensis TaxID=1608994 RepID=A0A0J6LYN3_9PSED|nr:MULTISPECIES: lipoprotein [Pseudomonas]GLX89091.1 lipoprotein [Pseudomonas fragi]KMN15012.1 lipoprotein [Pseudomonas weihenstephanensis]KMN19446.1 lipoprotein [Pseudomonas weihenstephanensis]KVV04829.1 hypothetical protein AP060_02241 [Pseudomonas sp. TAD18]KVV06638.1 hypothetical protein AP059_02184 [Pseudomonas sp. TAA207]
MRILLVLLLATTVTGCTRWSMNHHLNNAYRAYDRGHCETVMLELSEVDRDSRSRPYIWPQTAMLRGLCLERTKFYLDAAQTYQWIINEFPQSEYAYRAKARIETLRILKFIPGGGTTQALPAQI